MKITSWNINGIRSFRIGINEVLTNLASDVICFQEVKASRSTIETVNAIVPGFNAYFSFPKYSSAYSGVGTYCMDASKPFLAEEGLSGRINDSKDSIGYPAEVEEFTAADILSLESEGRAIMTCHDLNLTGTIKKLVIINVYCPRVDPEKPERGIYQINFYKLLENRANKFVSNGFHVLIVGDLNCSHKQIDHCDPGPLEEFDERPSRKWLSSFLSETKLGPKFVDTFRHFHPNEKEAFTCWSTQTGARKTNYGTRLDYILSDIDLIPYIEDSARHPEIEGSDHCPVSITLKNCAFIPSPKCPFICTKNWPEFSGKQRSLADFVQQNQKIGDNNPTAKRKKTEKKLITNFFTKTKDSEDSLTNPEASASLSSSQSSSQSELEVDEIEKPTKISKQAMAWKSLFKGPPKPPKCIHGETTLIRTVIKPGPNLGKQFYVCPKPPAATGNPEGRCNFFSWVKQN